LTAATLAETSCHLPAQMYIVSNFEIADGIDENWLSKEEHRRIHGTRMRFRGRETPEASISTGMNSSDHPVNLKWKAGESSLRVPMTRPWGTWAKAIERLVEKGKRQSPGWL